MFHLQVGSHEDESLILARHLGGLGASRVGVIFDRSPIGRRHLSFFVDEAEVLGLSLGASTSIHPLADGAAAQVAAVVSTKCDAVCYLGLGLSAPAVGRALRSAGFEGSRAMNTAGLRGWDPAFAADVDGFWYLDMASEHNEELQRLSAREHLSFREAASACRGWDLGRLVAEGLARAPERTREGVRSGLELIKWLPAAEGTRGRSSASDTEIAERSTAATSSFASGSAESHRKLTGRPFAADPMSGAGQHPRCAARFAMSSLLVERASRADLESLGRHVKSGVRTGRVAPRAKRYRQRERRANRGPASS